MHVSSLNKRLLARYEGVMANQHLNWKGMTFSSEPYDIVADKDSLVYLTADSENTLTTLEPGKKYIIGGIVDRNRYKNLCFNKAKEQGIAHGRLPIGEYIKMASRQVLTTNQVVEIMIEWLQERDWEKAFMKVIPQRKMPKVKQGTEEDEGEYAEEEYDDGDYDEDEEADHKDAETAECKEREAASEAQLQTEPDKMDVDAEKLASAQP